MEYGTSDIKGKYLPIFLNMFIVTGNQMPIWFPVAIKMYETAPSKTIWVFLGYLMHVYTILNIKVAYFFLFFNATGPNEEKKPRVYLEQGKQNKMCAFVNM